MTPLARMKKGRLYTKKTYHSLQYQTKNGAWPAGQKTGALIDSQAKDQCVWSTVWGDRGNHNHAKKRRQLHVGGKNAGGGVEQKSRPSAGQKGSCRKLVKGKRSPAPVRGF